MLRNRGVTTCGVTMWRNRVCRNRGVTGVTIHGVTVWHNRGVGCVRPCVCVPAIDDVKFRVTYLVLS